MDEPQRTAASEADRISTAGIERATPSGEKRTADLDGLSVSYVVAGDGPPVVLLHGGGLDSAAVSWKETIPTLAERFTVYAPDWPGYGESDPPDGPPSIRYYQRVLRRFLDALGLDSARVVGMSMGGGVALGFALDHPERVERLVVVDSYGLDGTVPGGPLGALFVRIPWLTEGVWTAMRPSRSLTATVLRNLVDSGNLTDDLVEDVLAELRRPNAGDAWERFQRNEVGFSGLKTNFRERLPELAVPALVVHGENDPLIPVAHAERVGTLAPNASVEVISRCGHWPPREKPETFVSLVGAFL